MVVRDRYSWVLLIGRFGASLWPSLGWAHSLDASRGSSGIVVVLVGLYAVLLWRRSLRWDIRFGAAIGRSGILVVSAPLAASTAVDRGADDSAREHAPPCVGTIVARVSDEKREHGCTHIHKHVLFLFS